MQAACLGDRFVQAGGGRLIRSAKLRERKAATALV